MLRPEDRLERELRQGLRTVTAPPELWDRVRAAQFTKSQWDCRPSIGREPWTMKRSPFRH
jgi:hypothetical protein